MTLDSCEHVHVLVLVTDLMLHQARANQRPTSFAKTCRWQEALGRIQKQHLPHKFFISTE